MSKIGKQPVKIPEGVSVKIEEGEVIISQGNKILNIPRLSGVDLSLDEGSKELRLTLKKGSGRSRGNWGTMRALLANAIKGITDGFEKTLILEGVGYRMKKEGQDLVLSLGYSHPIRYKEPEGITLEVGEKGNILKIKGFDKALVGQVAAEIRAMRKVEPYKGKGFRYEGEIVRRKAGKKAVATGA